MARFCGSLSGASTAGKKRHLELRGPWYSLVGCVCIQGPGALRFDSPIFLSVYSALATCLSESHLRDGFLWLTVGRDTVHCGKALLQSMKLLVSLCLQPEAGHIQEMGESRGLLQQSLIKKRVYRLTESAIFMKTFSQLGLPLSSDSSLCWIDIK